MLNFYGKTFSSRLLIGSALYPSPAIMQDAIRASGANIVTVSLRREAAGGKTGDAFWSLISELDVTVLPNTAGCRTVREAVTTAKLARELFATSWIKLEVIADNDTLQPDVVGLVEAAGILIKDGFEVFPYCTEDLSVAMRLVDAGCKVVMPWAAPIGSAKGSTNRDAVKLRRERLPDITLVVDAGLGAPSHAAHALELGYDAVLLNTAVAKAADPIAMATAFRLGVVHAKAECGGHRDRVGGFGDGRVEQHGVVAEFERVGRMRGRAEAGVDHQRNVGQALAPEFYCVAVSAA